MPHSFRYWKDPEPVDPDPLVPPRSRVAIVAIVASLLAVALSIGLLFAIMQTRTHERIAQQERINNTFCQVLAELPAGNPSLDSIRHHLGCNQPGILP